MNQVFESEFFCRRMLMMAALLCLGGTVACDTFDAPPQASLKEAVDGILADPAAPLVLAFNEPVKAETLKVKVVLHQTNSEGFLADEDDDDETDLEVIYERTGVIDTDSGGEGTLDESRTVFTMALTSTLPIGASLALIVEAGLSDDAGNVWRVRQVLIFGFELSCGADTGTAMFPSGVYFWLVDVDEPVATQIQLWSAVEVDPDTGIVRGQFTNADRDATIDCTPYGLNCDATEVCRTLPEPACVAQSERAGSVDEYPDYAINATPPTGYSFTVLGCVQDQADGTVAFTNAPADVIVESPPVTVKGTVFNSAFSNDADNVLRGAGTFVAEQVLIGSNPSGAGVGTHTERSVQLAEAPSDLPPVPPAE